MGHHLLHHESSLRCIEAQGTGQTMIDPIRQPLKSLPNPLTLLEGSTSHFLSRDELPPAGVEVVLGDRSLEGLQSLPAFSD